MCESLKPGGRLIAIRYKITTENNCDNLFSSSFYILIPAKYPVENAICKLNPPV